MFDQLYILPILLFSVIIHEIAHGVMALRLGDPTARAMGRLTLNPVPHIDLVGSILVPLFSLLVAGRVFIAWAKPVPVNPLNFSNYRRDDILVAVVGPLSNIALALACTVAVILFGLLGAPAAGLGSPMVEEGVGFLLKMFYGGVYLNIVLAVFNLIPVPPLDGSHVLASFLPDRLADQYRNLGFFGIFIVIFLMRVPLFNSLFNGIINAVSLPFESVIRLFL
jgi:Zn-dependent protease